MDTIKHNMVWTYRAFVVTFFLAVLLGYFVQSLFESSGSIYDDSYTFATNFRSFAMITMLVLSIGNLMAFFRRYSPAKLVLIVGGLLLIPIGLLIVWCGYKLKRIEPSDDYPKVTKRWLVVPFILAVATTLFSGAGVYYIVHNESEMIGTSLVLVVLSVLFCVITLFALYNSQGDFVYASEVQHTGLPEGD